MKPEAYKGQKEYERIRATLPAIDAERLRCALTLYQIGADIVNVESGKSVLPPESFEETPDQPRGENDEESNIRKICTSGAFAECYRSNLLHLGELLAAKRGVPKVGKKDVADEWRRYFDWIVRSGMRAPIEHWNGVTFVTYTFDNVHTLCQNAYLNVMAFRKEKLKRKQ